MPPLVVGSGRIWEVRFNLHLGLESGQYAFQISLGHPHPKPNLGMRFAETPWLGPITIDWDYANENAPFLGMFDLPATITMQEIR